MSSTRSNTGVKRRHAMQLFKTDMCKFFLQSRCGNGEQCSYAHSVEEVRSKPDLSRTSMCRSILQNQTCSDVNCRFAHSEMELRGTQGFFKKKMCGFAQSGKCKHGRSCRFAHTPEELRPMLRGAAADPDQPQPDGTFQVTNSDSPQLAPPVGAPPASQLLGARFKAAVPEPVGPLPLNLAEVTSQKQLRHLDGAAKHSMQPLKSEAAREVMESRTRRREVDGPAASSGSSSSRSSWPRPGGSVDSGSFSSMATRSSNLPPASSGSGSSSWPAVPGPQPRSLPSTSSVSAHASGSTDSSGDTGTAMGRGGSSSRAKANRGAAPIGLGVLPSNQLRSDDPKSREQIQVKRAVVENEKNESDSADGSSWTSGNSSSVVPRSEHTSDGSRCDVSGGSGDGSGASGGAMAEHAGAGSGASGTSNDTGSGNGHNGGEEHPQRSKQTRKKHSGDGPSQATTLLVTNIPHYFTQGALLSMFEDLTTSMRGNFDFFFCPWDEKAGHNLGYCLINFPDPSQAGLFQSTWSNKELCRGAGRGAKPLKVIKASLQGRGPNMEYFQKQDIARHEDLRFHPLYRDSTGVLQPLQSDTPFAELLGLPPSAMSSVATDLASAPSRTPAQLARSGQSARRTPEAAGFRPAEPQSWTSRNRTTRAGAAAGHPGAPRDNPGTTGEAPCPSPQQAQPAPEPWRAQGRLPGNVPEARPQAWASYGGQPMLASSAAEACSADIGTRDCAVVLDSRPPGHSEAPGFGVQAPLVTAIPQDLFGRVPQSPALALNFADQMRFFQSSGGAMAVPMCPDVHPGVPAIPANSAHFRYPMAPYVFIMPTEGLAGPFAQAPMQTQPRAATTGRTRSAASTGSRSRARGAVGFSSPTGGWATGGSSDEMYTD